MKNLFRYTEPKDLCDGEWELIANPSFSIQDCAHYMGAYSVCETVSDGWVDRGLFVDLDEAMKHAIKLSNGEN